MIPEISFPYKAERALKLTHRKLLSKISPKNYGANISTFWRGFSKDIR